MKRVLACLVASALLLGAGILLLKPRSSLPSTLGVALLDKATGERIEFGISADNAGHIFTNGLWTSKVGEKVAEDYHVLSADSARLHFAITQSGVTRTFVLTVTIQDRRAKAIRWQALGDHFETIAYAGGTIVTS